MFSSAHYCLSIFVLASLLTHAAAQPSPPATPTAPPVKPAWPTGTAATVNGEPLTEATVQRALLRVPREKRDQLRAEFVNDLIDHQLMDQYLRQVNPAIDAKEVDKQLSVIAEEIKKNGGEVDKVFGELYLTEKDVKEQITSELRWEAFLAQKATDDALKEVFAREPELVDGTMVRARHILFTPESNDAKVCEKAVADLKQIKLDIEKKVADGLTKLPSTADNLSRERERCKLIEETFSAIAREKSTCPGSKDAGGDVNFFPRGGIMVDPFAKAAFALKPYQMSDVIKTQYGYHLILVTDRKAGTPVKFEAVKEEIKEVFGNRLRSTIVTQVRSQSKISINPPPTKTTSESSPKQN